MQLLIIRHAIAQDRSKALKKGIGEADRALTHRGEKHFRSTVKMLVHLDVQIDFCWVSPWKRAQQTAQILAESIPIKKMKTASWLLPETPFEATHKKLLASWLQFTAGKHFKHEPVVAIVGHEPHLSEVLMSYLNLPLPWEREAVVDEMKCINLEKGAVAQIKFAERTPRPATGVLQRLIWN